MILDALTRFSDNQAIANAIGSYDSTNILDLGVASGIPGSDRGGGARDIGIGDHPALKILCQIGAAITSGGAATLQAQLQGAPDNGSGLPGTYYTLGASAVTPIASLGAGTRFFNHMMPSPGAGIPTPRFLKMIYIIAGAAITGGTITSALVLDRDDQVRGPTGLISAYPPGIRIQN